MTAAERKHINWCAWIQPILYPLRIEALKQLVKFILWFFTRSYLVSRTPSICCAMSRERRHVGSPYFVRVMHIQHSRHGKSSSKISEPSQKPCYEERRVCARARNCVYKTCTYCGNQFFFRAADKNANAQPRADGRPNSDVGECLCLCPIWSEMRKAKRKKSHAHVKWLFLHFMPLLLPFLFPLSSAVCARALRRSPVALCIVLGTQKTIIFFLLLLFISYISIRHESRSKIA